MNKKRRKPVISLCCLMSVLSGPLMSEAQHIEMRPPMLVSVTVEGLAGDYLKILEPMLCEGGFKRLMHGGVYISDVQFGPGVDPVAAAAIVYTGASPSVNGVPGAMIYNPESRVASQVFFDQSIPGNFTDETLSPDAIRVSTLADEMRMDSDGDGYVYSIAADPQVALASAGHAANGAYWINDKTANWATTTYYRDFLKPISDLNYQLPMKQRIDAEKWTPMFDMVSYPYLSQAERSNPFKISYPSKDVDRMSRFKASPGANREVTDLALAIMGSVPMGKDLSTDMLSVAYSLAPPDAGRAEIMDAYLRLDRDLARLFAAVDRSAGIGKSVVLLTGVPANVPTPRDDVRWRVPYGEFSIKKATYLLEMYLIALHGNGDWILGYHDRQIYLNRKLITDKGMNLSDFRAEVTEFMGRMSGISGVYTVDDVIAGRAGDDPQALKRNTLLSHCGDVFIEINPGWEIVESQSVGRPGVKSVERVAAVRIPAFILAPGVLSQKIDLPVDARALAPAVSGALRIRAPNAASVNSLAL